MNYAQIFEADIANGPGCRTSLFVSGCTHHCPECFNQETWDFCYGKAYTSEVEGHIMETLRAPYIAGLSILGGEPMEPVNQKAIRPLVERVKKEYPGKSIWIYSGYTFEELADPENRRCHSDDTMAILQAIDVLVDGEFKIEKKNIKLLYRGSENQRILDMKETMKTGSIVLTKYMS